MLYEASHGDTQHLVLIPGNVDECFEYAWKAFDYAEKYQTIVFGFSDLCEMASGLKLRSHAKSLREFRSKNKDIVLKYGQPLYECAECTERGQNLDGHTCTYWLLSAQLCWDCYGEFKA